MCWLDAYQYLNIQDYRLIPKIEFIRHDIITKIEFIRYGLISINHTINFRCIKNGSSSPLLRAYATSCSISITNDIYQMISEKFRK